MKSVGESVTVIRSESGEIIDQRINITGEGNASLHIVQKEAESGIIIYMGCTTSALKGFLERWGKSL